MAELLRFEIGTVRLISLAGEPFEGALTFPKDVVGAVFHVKQGVVHKPWIEEGYRALFEAFQRLPVANLRPTEIPQGLVEPTDFDGGVPVEGIYKKCLLQGLYGALGRVGEGASQVDVVLHQKRVITGHGFKTG
jgi:hypothetical protein